MNELLVDKYKVQKALDQEVGHNLSAYVEETHKRVLKLSKTSGLNFRYGIPRMVREDKEPNNTMNADS